MKHPGLALLIEVKIDTSAFTIGAIIRENNKWYSAVYMSHALSGVELNQLVYNKELYAIIKAFEAWHQWLLLAQHKIKGIV